MARWVRYLPSSISKGSQGLRACKLKEEPLGTMVHAESGERFTWKDPCVQTDSHTGYNEAAASAAGLPSRIS